MQDSTHARVYLSPPPQTFRAHGPNSSLDHATRSKLILDQNYPSCDQIAWRFMRIWFDQVNGVGKIQGSQNNPVTDEVEIAQSQMSVVPHGIKIGAVGAVGSQRDVMPVDEHDGVWKHHGIHCRRIFSRNADSDVALPGTPLLGATGARGLQQSCGHLEERLYCPRANMRFEERRRVRHQRDDAVLLIIEQSDVAGH